VIWGRQAGVLSGPEAEHLAEAARRRPADAAKALAAAVGLRETIFKIFAAVIAGRDPEQADLSALGAGLSQAMVHLRVLPRAAGAGATCGRVVTARRPGATTPGRKNDLNLSGRDRRAAGRTAHSSSSRK